MNKNLIFVLMLCIGFASTVKAEDTDLSAYDNVIYVASTSVEAGTNATLSICMKNTTSIRGFQFRLYLPEGVSVVKNSKNKIQVSLTANRLDEDDDHTISASEQNDGSVLILCGSEYPENFIGNDGEVATLPINVSSSIAEGNYPILITNIKLSETDISKFYETPEVVTTITVVATTVQRHLLDEEFTTAPEATDGAVNVRVRRTITAGNWSTICLPFAMTTAQVQEAFGDDVELADFAGYETEEEGDIIVGITVTFVNVSAIEANHPYIIKVSSAITEFTVDDVEIDPVPSPQVSFGYTTGKGKNTVYHPADFKGTYVANFDFYSDAASYPLFLSGNNFYYATENTKHMKAFRAYFDFDDYLPEAEGSASPIKMFVGGFETSIRDLVPATKVGVIYDLSGRKVSRPQKSGVYIVNGKKALIK